MEPTTIRHELIGPALEKIVDEILPQPITPLELMGVIGGLLDAYGIEGEEAEKFLLALASRAQEVNATKYTYRAMHNMMDEESND